MSRARGELASVAIALLGSMALGSVVMLALGIAPGGVWRDMFLGPLGDPAALGQVLYRATGVTLTGLSFALALDAGLFNIGGEGQLVAGLVACAAIGVTLPAGTPAILAVPACVGAAAIAGAAAGASIGVMRTRREAHEVITAIMENPTLAGTALWLGNAFLFMPGQTTSAPIAPGAELPRLGLGGSPANAAVVIALGAAVGLWWLRSRTTWGLAWRAVGRDPAAARAAGIDVARVRELAMVGAGALAGLAAANFVLGHKHAYEQSLGAGTGWLGISAALLGRVHPIGTAAAALLLGVLSAGGLAVGDRVPKELIEMLQGVIVLAVATAAAWVKRRGSR